MAFKLCCGCAMPSYLVPMRRWLQWEEILASERGTDTVDWVDGTSPYERYTWSPQEDENTTQTLYMKPVRFKQFGATATQNEYNPSYWLWAERIFEYPGATTTGHTFNIMSRVGMLPANSHAKQIRLTQVDYDVPGQQTYYAKPASPATSSTYTAEVDAARLWVNGVDVTGIVTSITPVIKFINGALEQITTNATTPFGINEIFEYKSDSLLSLSPASTVVVGEDDLIEIDIWYKINIGGGWCPKLSLDRFDFYESDNYPGRFRVSVSSTRPILTQLDSSVLSYAWHATLYAANVNGNVPRGYPWTVSYPVDAPWTPGSASTLDLSTTPVDSEYSIFLRPVSAQTVTPATIWDVTTYTNIDDVVEQPTAGDGSVASHGPHGSALQWVASGKWNLTTPVTTTDAITKVIVWYRARCDSLGDGGFPTMDLRYTVSGTTYIRVRNPPALTSSFAWYSQEFTGSDITSFTPGACQVQIDAELQSATGFVELDALYVEVQMSGDWTRTENSASVLLEHSSGDFLSFDWGREIPEIVVRRALGVPVSLGGSDGIKALYKPVDTGDYFSGSRQQGPPFAYLESAGVWNPQGETVFRRFGEFSTAIDPNEAYTPDEGIESYFPDTITVAKN